MFLLDRIQSSKVSRERRLHRRIWRPVADRPLMFIIICSFVVRPWHTHGAEPSLESLQFISPIMP